MSRYSAITASNTATYAVVRSRAALSASSFMSAARNWYAAKRRRHHHSPQIIPVSSGHPLSATISSFQSFHAPNASSSSKSRTTANTTCSEIPADTAPIPPVTITLPPNQDHHHLLVIQPPTFIDEQRLSGALRQLNVKVGVGV